MDGWKLYDVFFDKLIYAHGVLRRVRSRVFLTPIKISKKQINKDGFMFERGPRGFRPSGNGLTTLRLIEDLGLDSEALGTSSTSKNRFLWVDGRMMQLPSDPSSLFRDPKFSYTLISGLIRDLTTSKHEEDDETIFDFATRRFGVDIASVLVDSMISGIYAGNSKELSVRSCFPLLHKLERKHRSVVKGMFQRSGETVNCQHPDLQSFETQSEITKRLGTSMQVSFLGGMETLSNGLENALRKDEEMVSMKTNSCVSSLRPDENGRVVVSCENADDDIVVDHVVSTLPASAMSKITSEWNSSLRDVFENLASRTRPVNVCVVNMAWRDKTVQLPYDGFGFLVPSREWSELLGVTWDSLVFPSQQDPDTCVITAMLGGAHHPHIGDMNLEELEDLARRIVLPKLKINIDPSTILL